MFVLFLFNNLAPAPQKEIVDNSEYISKSKFWKENKPNKFKRNIGQKVLILNTLEQFSNNSESNSSDDLSI